MQSRSTPTNYDAIADGYNRRYDVYDFAGIERGLAAFVGGSRDVLEIGCGTGHWLAFLVESRRPRAETAAARVTGIDPSIQMLVRAQRASAGARLVRAVAECLPFPSGAFDRVIGINVAHHFASRVRAIIESRRVLREGGGLFVVGREPPSEADRWWVYDYFEQTRAIDRARYVTGETLRREMGAAGFARCETFEIARLIAPLPADEALRSGVVDRRFTSQLSILPDADFRRGVERVRAAADAAAARGERLMLEADIGYEATIGWVGGP
jgi:ubiquinone/menaquinone biosynthesis C-methylase UbiE